MTSGRISQTVWTSSREESRPSEKRTNEFARSGGTPIASNTCEGERDPEVQAEPLEAQMPSRSKPAKSEMLSQPETVKATVFERRQRATLRSATPSTDAAARRRREENESRRDSGKTGGLAKRSSASTNPTIAARFSVPARSSFSWPPP